jgi:uncharacterized protein (DUF2267 family)
MTIPPKAQSGDGSESAEDVVAKVIQDMYRDEYHAWTASEIARAVLSAIRERMLGEKAVRAAAEAFEDAYNLPTTAEDDCMRAALAAAVGALGVGE